MHTRLETMSNDVPYLRESEIRALFYMRQVNREMDQEHPATVSQLVERTDMPPSSYGGLLGKLSPMLVKDVCESPDATQPQLTEMGHRVLKNYTEINRIFDHAGV